MSGIHTDEFSLSVFIKLHFLSLVFQTNQNSLFFLFLSFFWLLRHNLSFLFDLILAQLVYHFSIHKHKPTKIWDNIWFKRERKICWAKIVLCLPWNGFVFDDIWFNHDKHKREKKIESSETRMSRQFWRERKVVEQWSLGCG